MGEINKNDGRRIGEPIKLLLRQREKLRRGFVNRGWRRESFVIVDLIDIRRCGDGRLIGAVSSDDSMIGDHSLKNSSRARARVFYNLSPCTSELVSASIE